jgi:hypothetical protein
MEIEMNTLSLDTVLERASVRVLSVYLRDGGKLVAFFYTTGLEMWLRSEWKKSQPQLIGEVIVTRVLRNIF